MSMNDSGLSAAATRVQQALAARGAAFNVIELPASTRTAADAAAAIGCTVAQIVKSLVFRDAHAERALLVLASGVNQVDMDKLAALASAPAAKADADFVRRVTGFAIGGIPPLGHATPLVPYIDRDLLGLGEVWAAAGTPHAVFALPAANLVALTGGIVADIRRDG